MDASQLALAAIARGSASALTSQGVPSSFNQVRVLPVDATTAFVIARHATLGAIAVKFVFGTGAVADSSNVGGSYGGWRLYGVYRLASVTDNPVTSYITQISEDIGSQQFALNFGAKYGGVYHGGLTTNRRVLTSLTDLTSEIFLPYFSLYHEFTIDWGGGNVMTGREWITVNPDGSISTSTTVNGGLIIDPGYLDMTIGEYIFDRARAEAGTLWTKLLGNEDQVSDTDYDFWADSVTLRDRSSGIEMTITDDARALAICPRKYVRRSPVNGSMRSKLYSRLTSTAIGGAAWPATTINRKITFADGGKEAAYAWSAATDGFDGMGKAAGITMPSRVAGAMRFTRSASTQTRAKFRMGVVAGGTYQLTIGTAIAGGGATSGSNGMTYAVTADNVDSVITPAPLVQSTFSALAAAGGVITFTAPAGANVVQLIVQMTTGTAGHLVDLTSWTLTRIS